MNYPAEIELTLSRLVRIWWALVWRTTAFGGLLALLMAWLTVRLGASGGMRMVPWLSVLSWLLYGLISLGVLRSVLTKHFRDFSFRTRTPSDRDSDPSIRERSPMMRYREDIDQCRRFD